MMGLSAANLARLSLPAPAYDRSALRAGIVHLGIGGFHRAHLARYVHDLLERESGAAPWGILGVGLRPEDRRLIDALRAQDCLYTLVESDAEARRPAIIRSLAGVMHRDDGIAPLLRVIDSARIVSLTVTENGYCLDPATKRLDAGHPAIAADLQTPHEPRSAIGVIVEGLRRRSQEKRPAFTALSCDNIQHNGAVLRQAVLDYAAACDPYLADWIVAEGRFPSTMVDRITPALTSAQIKTVAEEFGYADACPVFCEPFRQFVVEDDFADGRPALESLGVQFVADVAPYEAMKLRLLNASHLAMAGVGRLMGLAHVDEAMRVKDMEAYLARLMESETGPTLQAVPGVDLAAYKLELLRRFANPAIRDTLDRINADAPLNYLLDPVRDRLAASAPIPLLALAVAAWIKRWRGVDDQGGAIALTHPLAETLRREAGRGGADPRAVLSIAPLFGEMGRRADFAAPVEQWLGLLDRHGAAATLSRALAEPSGG